MDRREAQRLRRRNQQLEEENNLLRLKVDILLDMVRRAMEGIPRLSFQGGPTEGPFHPADTPKCPFAPW